MPQFRFSLKSLFIATTIASLLCVLAFIVGPQIWGLIGELLAVRTFKKVVLAGIGLAAVFVAVLFLAALVRYATLFLSGLEEPRGREFANDTNPRE